MRSMERETLAATMLGSSIVFIDATVVSVILPKLQTALNVTAVQIQWVVEAYLLLLSALILLGGALGDRFGRKRILQIGTILFVSASIACVLGYLPGLNANYWTGFSPGLIVLGIGMAICIAPLTTAVLGAVEAKYSGLASGINNAIARIAGLLAIAAFTLFIVSSFQRNLGQGLKAVAIPRN